MEEKMNEEYEELSFSMEIEKPNTLLELHGSLLSPYFLESFRAKSTRDDSLTTTFYKYCVIYLVKELNLESEVVNEKLLEISRKIGHSITLAYQWMEPKTSKKIEWDEKEIMGLIPSIDLNFSKFYFQSYINLNPNGVRPNSVKLPSSELETSFFKNASAYFKNNQQFLYNITTGKVVEIAKEFSISENCEIFKFREVTPKRFLTVLDNMINCYVIKQNGFEIVYKSPSELLISHLLESDSLKNTLNKVERFSQFPVLCKNSKGNLEIAGNGYNEHLQCYFFNCPEIEFMDVEEAKNNLNLIMSDIAFKEDNDKLLYWSYLLTPACRTLYNNLNDKSPMFCFFGNREGCGKDTAASFSQLIYTGEYVEREPFANEKQTNNEEISKKLFTALKNGVRLYHSSNNKGSLRSESLEAVLQSRYFTGRILGASEELKVPVECDFSLSGNIGLTITSDLKRRSRIINLKVNEEFIEKKKYKNPNPHSYILANRKLLLSSIFSLIKYWHDMGEPAGNLFSGFQEWGRVVGGICECCKLGDPTFVQCDNEMEDAETKSMRCLFETMSDKVNGEGGFLARDICQVISTNLQPEGHFSFLDSGDERGGVTKIFQIKMGKLLRKYTDRIFSGIQLRVNGKPQINGRTEYVFLRVE
jgi:hypothetical protein